MSKYFRIYLQKESDGAEVVDTIASFGMYCMDNPFKTCSEVKEPTKRTWYDEEGDDEYVGEDGLKWAAYENKVKFGFKGEEYGANEKLRSFLEYLRGGLMKMYCEFNGIGRRHVRLKSVDQTLVRNVNDGDILILSVTFKFNDPTTAIKPIKNGSGVITELG